MTVQGPMFDSAAHSECGKVRGRNEDAFLDASGLRLWAVADGMGGHHDGHIASRLIVDTLAQLPCDLPLDARLAQLRQRLQVLNRQLCLDLTQSLGQPPRIIGSTLVALLLQGEQGACCWAGDSRCYLWRDQRLYQLTHDHTHAHALTRAVGACHPLRLELLHWRVRPGDTYLLCSDGLYQALDSAALGRALSQPTAARALSGLFTQAMQGPATDNLTGVVVRT
ncbi:serine/threonine-protein phosphatase [Pseudomonas syringae]|nr:serine/threonine-protein phosphatase [Pseudomonas syringae]MBD8792839.1 serine/threonine-protein phosphatase [Pseudomonas syringae]MBD8803342.1 serine/threonine-protein phosphatase [Pseudomonas syringae]MBD8811939.1 serine/threonine-protein phosphatase [Pseudomonas syringae]